MRDYDDWLERDYEFEEQEKQRREDEKRLNHLEFYIDCLQELTIILEDGWNITRREDGVYECESANGRFSGRGETFEEAFFHMYYSVVEHEDFQEVEEEPKKWFGVSDEEWFKYWAEQERKDIERSQGISL